MRILHLCLLGPYSDGYYYQDNMLPQQNSKDGHIVEIIAPTEKIVNGIVQDDRIPITYTDPSGVKIIRIPVIRIVNQFISTRIRAYKNIYSLISEFNPDIMFYHCFGGKELLTVAKYVSKHPKVKLFIDTHSDYENSATNFLSKFLLHKVFHKFTFKKAVKYAEKVYYVAPESLVFIKDLYGFNDKTKLEFFPLGGYIIENEKRIIYKEKVRSELNISHDDLIFIHSGKFSEEKKTYELVTAFNKVKSTRLHLLIIGSFEENVYSKVESLIENDSRISYLGWKTTEDLEMYLCASDVYILPGSRTVTVQHAICCGCAIITNRSYVYTYLLKDIPIYADTIDELINAINLMENESQIILDQKEKLSYLAKTELDYRILANRYVY